MQPATRRRLLLFIAALIAGAGVAYELSLMLLGTVTLGSTEQANAIVLGTAMFGMGVGATTGGRWADRPVVAFVRTEVILAILGAAAAPALYWTWARLDAFWGPLLGISFAIGVCIGAEMPLLAALNDRIEKQSASTVVADYTAADYFGALIGAVGFAFLVRPIFGLVNGALVVAVLNLMAAATVPFIVGDRAGWRSPPVHWLGVGAVGVLALAVVAPSIVDDGRQALFRDPIVETAESGVQQLVVTSRTHPGGRVDTRLFLDNDLQLSSVDEHRYHESLVHPAVTGGGDVLILGGGDCLAAREVLRHEHVASITMVELDPMVVELMVTVPELEVIHEGACDDPRLSIVNEDAFVWVSERRSEALSFETIIVDFPDPDTPALGRLYSLELYGLIAELISDNGQLVVQCGSPFFAPEAYWTCAETLEAAGWQTLPYHVDVPSFGDWGFHLATRSGRFDLTIEPVDGLEFIDDDVIAAATVFPVDVRREGFEVRPSTILDPSIVEAAQGAWIGYDG